MPRREILPGFKLSMGVTVAYLSLIVLIPLAALAAKASTGTAEQWRAILTDERVMASLKVSFGCSFIAAVVCGFFGLLTAWALVRYRFPGRRLIDAAVDLPFALPTAVAGIALTTLYAPNGWGGKALAEFGIKGAFTPLGVTLALIFVGFPFVVRTVQPVIRELSLETEEAAACLGASRWQTFRKVILPALIPSLLTGMTLSFGRAVGEYGSVVFISGNLPYKTEIAPLLIVSRLEQFDYTGATILGAIMLAASFGILVVSNLFQWWSARRAAV